MARNTKAASPQQQIILKVMPGFFGLISLSIPAAVNVYFLVSALFRISQTAAMYRFDPTLSAHAAKHAREIEAKATEVKRPPRAGGKQPPGSDGSPERKAQEGKGGGGAAKASGNGSKPGSNRAGQQKSGGNGRRQPPRPQQKRRTKKGR